MKEYNRKYYLAHREARIRYVCDYQKQHPEQTKAKYKRYRETHRAQCIEATRNWQKRNPERVREIHRAYRQRHPEVGAKWRKENREKVRESNRRHIERYPEKRTARIKAQYIPLGEKCEECGTTQNLEHHHPDYSKPLEVVTLCRKCHNKKNRINYVS